MTNREIPVIIPSYEPDEKMLQLLERLNREQIDNVIIVDDGSETREQQLIFEKAETEYGYTVLHHAVNLGKGRALKTAFNYCLIHYPDAVGCVTIDSDGQHTIKDMLVCMETLKNHPDALVLGMRDFNKSGIPKRSVFGNKCTSQVMKIFTGIAIKDTQTGLRAIPAGFMRDLLAQKGEHFEFETNMLIDTKEKNISIIEVPIETIYMEENRSSHFNPLKDSVRIYAIFAKFIFSSLSSSIIDLLLFTVFCHFLQDKNMNISYILLATVFARILSAAYNFTINYRIVFKSKNHTGRAVVKYAVLAVCIMLLSGFFVDYFYTLLLIPEIIVKIPVDIILFLLSFLIQREFVYR